MSYIEIDKLEINESTSRTSTIQSVNKSLHYTFKKTNGKVNLKKYESVLTKTQNKFKKFRVDQWGDIVLPAVKKFLETDKANNVAETDPRFDPAFMGKVATVPLGKLWYHEEFQRLMEPDNLKNIVSNFDIRYFTCVLCVIIEDKTTGETVEQFASTIDGWHHTVGLYCQIRAGNIKGVDPDDWEDFPIPAQVWETDDPTFPGRLSLLVNGEGQKPWGEFEYIRLHSNNYRFYPDRATEVDKLAYEQVQACIKEGNSLPISQNDDSLKKKPGVITHINAIRNSKNDDVDRLRFIMKTNHDWWPNEKRSAAMFGFYGNIYDEFVRIGRPLKGQQFDDQMLAYHYVIQHVFDNLEGAMKAIAGKNGAMTKLEAMTNDGWKQPAGDHALLAMVEILYKDYLQGPERISSARGSFTHVQKNGKVLNIIDALKQLPNTNYAQQIATL
jgi:hypothetical protein